MNKEQAKAIIERYNLGQASAREKAWLDNWYLQESKKHEFSAKELNFLGLKEEIWQATKELSGLATRPAPKRLRLWPGFAAAIALIVFGLYFYIEASKPRLRDMAKASHIVPGMNKATITLANGKVIALSEAKNGVVVGEDLKYDDGSPLSGLQPSLPRGARGDNAVLALTTPRGGTYQITLSDGTKVWLNAASSLHYPAVFNGAERKVQLKGEAYFEVAKNPKAPFRVESNGQVTEVLGTHFNINAYQDEPGTTTTLLEGSVRVLKPNSDREVLLKPGQQASPAANGGFKVSKVNPEQYVAWKDGKFIFANANIESIMRQVARWYNVEIEYKGSPSKEKFGGRTSRFANIAELLEILELTDHVQFKIEGRRIIVMP
ncbi:FecR family protein [Pedobacter africanus]|uniref:FecR family protein n=1 Tax=Pedobacter africanus TaxID=151894 RepID=A0A1W2B7X6_9SPHI|nr:FecR family protein [Pedobacter africanus]SMC68944.1 FecR family protein [Pedobacter africanus]